MSTVNGSGPGGPVDIGGGLDGVREAADEVSARPDASQEAPYATIPTD